MRLLLSVLSLLISIQTFAHPNQQVEIELTLSQDGKIISTPRLNVLMGEEGLVEFKNKQSKKKNFIHLQASPGNIQGQDGILIKMKIGEEKNSQKVVLYSPEVFTLDGQSTEFSIQTQYPQAKEFKIQVTPNLL